MSLAASFPNQPSPFEGTNLATIDAALRETIAREASSAAATIEAWGDWLGSGDAYGLAEAANRNPPQLRQYDRRGERIDEVSFHPAWHELMRRAMAAGEHCAPWTAPGSSAHVARAAMYYLHAQVENGTQCPLTMTFAATPVLARHAASLPPESGLATESGHAAVTAAAHGATAGSTARPPGRLLVAAYDPRDLPLHAKRSALIGMGMTERQGGSDLRANLTRAEPRGDGAWSITGHKWFFSAPQCDAHLVLARTSVGLGCFLLPRLLPDGARNHVRLLRLKDKLGNRSNASAEVEFDDALAWPLGDPGRGIATILEMVSLTRLDCVIASAGIMRGLLARALHHAQERIAFGARLVDQPQMRTVLADLALETEAALALAIRLARSSDEAAPPASRLAARLVAPAAKFWVCRRAIAVAGEAMEVLGGNGYIEEAPLARFYREAPVNSIWEGSGNVVCLDIGRAARKEPESIDALAVELSEVRGQSPGFDRHVDRLMAALRSTPDDAAGSRHLAQSIALAVSAAELLRHAPAPVGNAFCASRFDGEPFGGAAFGTTGAIATRDAALIVGRAIPGVLGD